MNEREGAIRARCDAATPGPWYSGDGSVDRFFAGKNTVATRERVIVERATYNDDFDRQTYADLDFIIHARTDIPELLDDNAHLTAALADMTAERDAANAKNARMLALLRDYATHIDRTRKERDAANKRAEAAVGWADCIVDVMTSSRRGIVEERFSALAGFRKWREMDRRGPDAQTGST